MCLWIENIHFTDSTLSTAYKTMKYDLGSLSTIWTGVAQCKESVWSGLALFAILYILAAASHIWPLPNLALCYEFYISNLTEVKYFYLTIFLQTVDSRYLELQGTLWNTSRYP